jgi:hypothetical protein
VIDRQDYFDQVMVYIYLNPVRAGLVDHPMEHVFSGHGELMGKIRKPLVDVDHALIGFGGTLKKARRHYSARMRSGIDERSPGKSPGGFGLLSPPDRDLEAPEPVYIDELGRSTGLERPALDAQQYLLAACSILDVEFERLASRRRDVLTVSGTFMNYPEHQRVHVRVPGGQIALDLHHCRSVSSDRLWFPMLGTT